MLLLLVMLLAACGGAQPEAGAPAEPTSEAVGAPDGEADDDGRGFQESGLLTVPFAAGAREYRYTLTLPASWRGRYTLTPESESATTFAFVPDDEQRIPIFTIIAQEESEWASAPAPGATAVTTFEGIVFAIRPGEAEALAAVGGEAATMLAELPAIIESVEITRNEDPSG